MRHRQGDEKWPKSRNNLTSVNWDVLTCGVGHDGKVTNFAKLPPLVTQVLISKNSRNFLSLKARLMIKTYCFINANKPKIIWIKLEQKQAEK